VSLSTCRRATGCFARVFSVTRSLYSPAAETVLRTVSIPAPETEITPAAGTLTVTMNDAPRTTRLRTLTFPCGAPPELGFAGPAKVTVAQLGAAG
jgi:hypothetical protein